MIRNTFQLMSTLLIVAGISIQARALLSCRSTHSNSQTILEAKKTVKSTKAKVTSSPSSGFGGAAVKFCPCGSGISYMKCCGKLHSDENVYATATAEQVVRARYSAYAKREVSSNQYILRYGVVRVLEWMSSLQQEFSSNFYFLQIDFIIGSTHPLNKDFKTDLKSWKNQIE